MKPYLTRLAQRAAPLRETARVSVAPVDPFASVEIESPRTETAQVEPGSRRSMTVRHEAHSPSKSREPRAVVPTSIEVPTVLHAKPELPPQGSLATKLAPTDHGDESDLTEQHIPSGTSAPDHVRSLSPPEARDPVPSIGHEVDGKEFERTVNAANSPDGEPAKEVSLESDLLRLADRFMEGLQRGISVSPAPDERERDAPPLLPSHQPERHSPQAQTSDTDSAPESLVRIGSLNIEIVSPNAAPAGVMHSPTPQTFRHGVARSFRRGIPSRQRVGLRQV